MEKKKHGRPFRPVKFWMKHEPNKVYRLPSVTAACEMLAQARKNTAVPPNHYYNTVVRTIYIPNAYAYGVFKFAYDDEEVKSDA